MIGSVVDKVMRASPIPVLAVPVKGGGRIGKDAVSAEEAGADDAEEKVADEGAPEKEAGSEDASTTA